MAPSPTTSIARRPQNLTAANIIAEMEAAIRDHMGIANLMLETGHPAYAVNAAQSAYAVSCVLHHLTKTVSHRNLMLATNDLRGKVEKAQS